jgi:PST family polysaccharide transporter
VAYIAYNLDRVLLGRFSGAEVVGIYGRAYQLVVLPTEHLNSAASGVAFPVLSRLQKEPARLRSYFLKGYSLVLSLTIPITAACALFADQIILLVLGPKWTDAVPIFRLLTPTILVLALINPTGWLLVAQGMIVRSLKLAFALLPVVVTGCVLGLPYGARGVALGYSIAMVLWVVPHLMWCFHGTAVSFRDVVMVASRPLLSGIVGALFASCVLMFAGSLPAVAVLVLGVAVLFAVYALVLLFVMGQKALYLDLFHGLRGRASESALVSA